MDLFAVATRRTFLTQAGLGLAYIALGWPSRGHAASSDPWTTLLDGRIGLANWNRIGDANWRVAEGVVLADRGKEGG